MVTPVVLVQTSRKTFNEIIMLFYFILFIFGLKVILHIICVTFQDATANDIPGESFDVQGYPTVYFRSASGKISHYDGDRTKEDIIQFIEKNRDKPAQQEQAKDEPPKPEQGKDEL